jgi:hypothetical protein
MMSTDKALAQQAAAAWWKSEASARARARGFAICDRCNGQIFVAKGCLCVPAMTGMANVDPAYFSSPDLVCEKCFDRGGYSPYKGEFKPQKKWWQFWK